MSEKPLVKVRERCVVRGGTLRMALSFHRSVTCLYVHGVRKGGGLRDRGAISFIYRIPYRICTQTHDKSKMEDAHSYAQVERYARLCYQAVRLL